MSNRWHFSSAPLENRSTNSQAKAEAKIAKKAAKEARKAEKAEKAVKKALDGGAKPKKKKKAVEVVAETGATEAVIIPLKDVAKA